MLKTASVIKAVGGAGGQGAIGIGQSISLRAWDFSRSAAARRDSMRSAELLDSIDTSTIVGLRDRALISVMTFAFARIGAVVAMRVEDYYPQGQALVGSSA